MLSVSAHLTDRDRELVRLMARHRVLTTDQLAALRFRNLTTARHRLSELVRLGLLRTSQVVNLTRQAGRLEICAPAMNLSLSHGNRASGRGPRRWRPRCRR